MKKRIFSILTFLLIWFSPMVSSQNLDIEDTTSIIGVESLSFLFDETVTKIGADFFRQFHSQWVTPSDIHSVSIYVGEKPIPGMGTQIWIKVDERYVYRSVLRPNSEQLKTEVKKALGLVRNYFINYELIKKQLDSQDYSGNGIY